MPIEITCKVCGTKKKIAPYLVKETGNYCSRSCKAKDMTGEKNSFFGKTHTKTVKKEIKRSCGDRKGEKNPFYGKTHTESSKDAISQSQRERYKDEQFKESFHDSRVEMWKDPKYRKNRKKSEN